MARFNEIECMICHHFFEPSDENRAKVLTEDHTITCPCCGKTFYPKGDDLSWMTDGVRFLDIPS